MITEEELFNRAFQEKVKKLIHEEKPLVMSTYILNPNEESKLNFILDELLEKFRLLNCKELFYTACRELIVNSAKAAVKRVFFEERNLDIHNEAIYQDVMPDFKKIINSNQMGNYREKVFSKGLKIEIHFTYTNGTICLQVINNFPLIKE
ncbi:MAG: hypothetical protein AAF518_25540, partial [Spirochaetota bacterium]